MINKMPKGIKHKVVTYGRRSAAVGNTMFGQNQVLCVGDVKTRIVTWDTCCAIAEYILFEQVLYILRSQCIPYFFLFYEFSQLCVW